MEKYVGCRSVIGCCDSTGPSHQHALVLFLRRQRLSFNALRDMREQIVENLMKDVFRISSMTDPLVFNPKCLVPSLQFSTGPSKRFEGQEIVRTLSHRIPGGSGLYVSSFSRSFPLIYNYKFEVFAEERGNKQP